MRVPPLAPLLHLRPRPVAQSTRWTPRIELNATRAADLTFGQEAAALASRIAHRETVWHFAGLKKMLPEP